MTIQELIDKLQEIPDKDKEIIINADGLLMEIKEIRKESFAAISWAKLANCYTIYHP